MPHNPYHPRISNVQIRPAIPMSGYDYSYGGGPVDLSRFAPTAQEYAGEPNVLTTKDFEYQPVLEEDQKVQGGRIVGKDATEGIGRNLQGLADFATFGIFDFDKRGGLFGGSHSGSGYGGKPTEHMLPNVYQQNPSVNPMLGGNPIPNINQVVDANIDYNRRMGPIALQQSQAWENQRLANLPRQYAIQEKWLDRAAEKAAQRGMRIRAWKEGLPSNVQNIMASKQAQMGAASSAWAEELKAAATAQQAANQFGAPSATIGRRFG